MVDERQRVNVGFYGSSPERVDGRGQRHVDMTTSLPTVTAVNNSWTRA